MRIHNDCLFGNEDGSRLMSNAPTAKEIRLFCDGELSLPEAAAIESKLRDHPRANALGDFERDLKTRVATILKDGSTPPAGLVDRVREALAARGSVADEVDPAGRIGRPSDAPAPRRAWWQAPLHANAFAVAASLVLVAGAVLFGIFGQPIDAYRPPAMTDISEVAAAVAAEHMGTREGRPHRPARFNTPEDAGRGLTDYLGEAGCVYDLSDMGYKFVGGDTCEVPHCGRGCHLIYRGTGPKKGVISLHIVPRRDWLQTRGTTGLNVLPLPTDKIARDANCQMDVLVWNHGDRFYLLSVCNRRDAEAIALRMQEALLARRP